MTRLSEVLMAAALAFGACSAASTPAKCSPRRSTAKRAPRHHQGQGGQRGRRRRDRRGDLSPSLVGASRSSSPPTVTASTSSARCRPGVYTLTIYYNDMPFSQAATSSSRSARKPSSTSPSTAPPARAAARDRDQGSAPIIDQGFDQAPARRSPTITRATSRPAAFGAVLGSAAGSQGDRYGTSIAGATSSENIFVVEGINTTDTGFGGISSNLPNEFIQETEVISGGYNAEFGRATGGIVNVVTKQGSNELRGSVFGYCQAGAPCTPTPS